MKLNTWDYVDFFQMKYNQVGQPPSFSIYNQEIISRRKPTTNFKVTYSRSNNDSPLAVRLRADLERPVNNPNISPVIDFYRLRFQYQDD